MGRISKADEDAQPAGILAPAPEIDLALLLELLGRQVEVWRQEIAQRRPPTTIRTSIPSYARLPYRVQQLLAELSEAGRVSSEESYKRDAFQKMVELKAWAAEDIVHLGALVDKDEDYFQTCVGWSRTLLAILEEFV